MSVEFCLASSIGSSGITLACWHQYKIKKKVVALERFNRCFCLFDWKRTYLKRTLVRYAVAGVKTKDCTFLAQHWNFREFRWFFFKVFFKPFFRSDCASSNTHSPTKWTWHYISIFVLLKRESLISEHNSWSESLDTRITHTLENFRLISRPG